MGGCMVVDYRFLQKYGGNKGDPRERMAIMDAQRAARPRRDTNLFRAYLRGWFYFKVVGLIVSIIIAFVMLTSLL